MLVNWQKRNTAVGVAHNVALANRIRALDPETEKQGLDLLVKEAEHFSGANNAAEKGTYIHLLTESVDAGENVVIPPEYLPIVSAYKNTVQDFGLTGPIIYQKPPDLGALKYLADRIMGKPTERKEHTIDRPLEELTEDELRAIRDS